MELFLSNLSDLIVKYPYSKTAILSVLLFSFYYLSKFILISNIEKKDINRTEKTFYKKKSKQYLRYFFLVILFLLWFAQLQVVFVSIFAIAAAIVIAFKELIMCLTGGILIRSSRTFKTGDRIEMNNLRGYVLDKSLLTTKVLEIGPESNSQQTTGDIITIPNSLMLSQAVKNESYFKGYSIKSFHYRMKKASDANEFENELLASANAICADYLEEAEKSIGKFCEKEGFVIPSVSPRTKIIVEDEKMFVLIKMPVINSEVGNIEQKLNRLYINWLGNIEAQSAS